MFDSDYEESRFHYTQGNHYWYQNDGLAASIEHFQMAVDLMPEESGLRYTLGFALHQAKRNEEALHHFTMAYGLDPTLHKAECLMAEVLLDLNRYDLAERHYLHFERLDAAREAWHKAAELGSEAIAAQAKRALERYAA